MRVADEGAPSVSATTTCPASCTTLSSLIRRRASPSISITCAEGVRSCQLDTFADSSGTSDGPRGRLKGVDTGLRDTATDEGYDQ